MTLETLIFGRVYLITVAPDGRVTARLASEEKQ